MSDVAMTWEQAIPIFLILVGLSALVHLIIRIVPRRVRKGVRPRDYAKPCHGCRLGSMSRVGEPPVRSEDLIARTARRLSARLRA